MNTTIKEDITREQIIDLVNEAKEAERGYIGGLDWDDDGLPHMTMFIAKYPLGEIEIHHGPIDPTFYSNREKQASLVHQLGLHALRFRALGMITCNPVWSKSFTSEDEARELATELKAAGKKLQDLEPHRKGEAIMLQALFPAYPHMHFARVTRSPGKPPELGEWTEIPLDKENPQFLSEYHNLFPMIQLAADVRRSLDDEGFKSLIVNVEASVVMAEKLFGGFSGAIIGGKTPDEVCEKVKAMHRRDDQAKRAPFN
jgi:hypothetical protein